MYLPSTELQLYRGQWTCPYCIMDVQDEERRIEARSHQAAHESTDRHLDSDQEAERCDKCRRKLSFVYLFNGKKLCENCVDKEKDEWKEQGGGGTPAVMRLRVKGNESMLSKLVTKLASSISDMVDEKRKNDKNEKSDSEKDKTKGEGRPDDGRGKGAILTPLAFRERITTKKDSDDSGDGPGQIVEDKGEKGADEEKKEEESEKEDKTDNKNERKGEFGKFFENKKKEKK